MSDAEYDRDEAIREHAERPMRDWIWDNQESLADDFIKDNKKGKEFGRYAKKNCNKKNFACMLEFAEEQYPDDFNEYCKDAFHSCED